MQPSSPINIMVATEVLATLNIIALQLVTDRRETLHGIITKKRHSEQDRFWPITSDIALEPNVGFRGYCRHCTKRAQSTSVANDPEQTLYCFG
jgi:hypothetical protein